MRTLLVWILKAYRAVISPLYGQVCRYHPSCSAYALEAVQLHGAARGSWLAVRRLVRCHPWTPGGYDPVPGSDNDVAVDQASTVRPDSEETGGTRGTGGPAVPPATGSGTAEGFHDLDGETARPSLPASTSPATSRGAHA